GVYAGDVDSNHAIRVRRRVVIGASAVHAPVDRQSVGGDRDAAPRSPERARAGAPDAALRDCLDDGDLAVWRSPDSAARPDRLRWGEGGGAVREYGCIPRSGSTSAAAPDAVGGATLGGGARRGSRAVRYRHDRTAGRDLHACGISSWGARRLRGPRIRIDPQ